MPQTTPETDSDDLKKKLVRRVAFAAVLIGVLLGALAFVDYLGQPIDAPVSTGPTFTEPVPVAKKEVSLPVTPAEPVSPPVATSDASTVAAGGAPAAASEEPTAAPSVPAPAVETPSPPQVAAQPVLPKTPARAAAPAGPAQKQVAAAVPESTAAASVEREPAAEKMAQPTAVPAQPLAAAKATPPAPPRLFSGYAVQVGVFSDARHAEDLREKLAQSGIPTVLEARVQVGPFKTREEAEAARQKLKTLGVEGILLPPKSAKR
ncbi:MAG: SPOR domain-containing protein [Zoogloeaceae bacterium]|nr:SPOR domain-containing protein [Zoogloeaceae bacterium]